MIQALLTRDMKSYHASAHGYNEDRPSEYPEEAPGDTHPVTLLFVHLLPAFSPGLRFEHVRDPKSEKSGPRLLPPSDWPVTLTAFTVAPAWTQQDEVAPKINLKQLTPKTGSSESAFNGFEPQFVFKNSVPALSGI